MPVYSHSRLSTFENCRLQYKLRYVDKIIVDRDTIEAFLGSRFHEVMEKLYRDLNVKVRSLEELLAYFEERWAAEIHDGVKINRPDRTAGDYRLLGRCFIEDYYRRLHPFDQSRVLGLEQRIFVDLDRTGRHRVMGYIDRLAQAPDGTFEIHDYKTSSGLPPQQELDEDRQLALYQIGVEARWRDVRSVRLIWHYVAFDKDLTSERTPPQLETLKAGVIALIDEIEATPPERMEPHESALCDWCSYWEYCPRKKQV